MAEMFEKIVEIRSLYAAWRKVRANKGSAGIDQISWFGFEEALDANLAELSRNLKTLTYQPLPAKFVSIAKANGQTRELGILTIRDRVAQRAVLDAIEPIFEADMQECSYAFRPARNIEMAIQRLIVNRANGDLWTVESDIENYFPQIDIRLLLGDLRQKIDDDNVLHLIELWLEAGTLRESDAVSEKTWCRITQANRTDVQDLIGETINESIDNFVASRLGLTAYEEEYLQFNPDVRDALSLTDAPDVADEMKAEIARAKSGTRRTALKKLLESGFIYAIANRAVLGRFLGMKALGIGGALLAGGLVAPKAIEAAKRYLRTRKGVLQGSPISPLLANVYLNDFDKRLTAKGLRLIRYCDDFVVTCKTEEEAISALALVESEIGKRKLTLHPEKTRIVAPDDDFEFLGFRFTENGIVRMPDSVPEKIAEQFAKASACLPELRGIRNLASWEHILRALNRRRD